MRAIIYQHEATEGPGLLGPALERAGFILETRMRSVQPTDEAVDLLVVLGGRMGVYEAAQQPILQDELRVLRERLRQDRPVLGICLGAQLLAAAAGARVAPGTHGFELGVAPLTLTAAGQRDPCLSGIGAVVHWHGDTWDEVPGGELLASTDRYLQQAFRLGRSYGLQFHAELDAAAYRQWLDAARADIVRGGRELGDLLAVDLPRLEAGLPAMRALLERLAEHFAAACA